MDLIENFGNEYCKNLREAIESGWLTWEDFRELGNVSVPRHTHARMIKVINDALTAIGLVPLNEVRVNQQSLNESEKSQRELFRVTGDRRINCSLDVVGLKDNETAGLVVQYESIDSDVDLANSQGAAHSQNLDLVEIKLIIKDLVRLAGKAGDILGLVLIITTTRSGKARRRRRANYLKGNLQPDECAEIYKKTREIINEVWRKPLNRARHQVLLVSICDKEVRRDYWGERAWEPELFKLSIPERPRS